MNYTKTFKKKKEVNEWILQNCDQWLKDNNGDYREKIYTALFPDISIFCPYGLKKRLQRPLFEGYCCSIHCQCVADQKKDTCLKIYGGFAPMCDEIIQEKSRQKCLDKFGVPNVSQDPEIREQQKKTCIENWGVDNPSKSPIVKERKKETTLLNWGVENPAFSPILQQNKKNTCQELYGVDYITQSEIFKETSKKTMLRKYEVEYGSQINFSKETFEILSSSNKFTTFIKHKSTKEIAKQLSISGETVLNYCYKYNTPMPSRGKSIQEKHISDWLTSLNIFHFCNYRKIIYPLELDIFLPEYNIGVEFQGDYWHMNPNIYEAQDFNKRTHRTAQQQWNRDQTKLEKCKDKGITLIIIWESDWLAFEENTKSNILNRIKTSSKKVNGKSDDVKG